MFKGKIPVGALKGCVDAIRAIEIDAVMVNISAGGWAIRAVDPAKVAMVSFELDSSAFSDFQFWPKESGGDKIKIGVDFAALDGMLDEGIIEKEEEVELELDEQAEKLFVKTNIFEYALSLSDSFPVIREPKLSDIDFSALAIIEADKLIRSICAAKKIDDHAALTTEEGVLYLKAKGERNTLKAALSGMVTKDTGNAHSTYSLDYLLTMTKAIRHAEEDVTLEFRTDYPLSINFEMDEGRGRVKYFLAPRMPPDEEDSF